MTVSATTTEVLCGSELYEACKALFERYGHSVKTTGWSRHCRELPWERCVGFSVEAGEVNLNIELDDDTFTVKFIGDTAPKDLRYHGRVDSCDHLRFEDPARQIYDHVPASLIALLQQAVAFPRMDSAYGLLDSRGQVSVMFYCNIMQGEDRGLPSLRIYVLQDDESSAWTPDNFTLAEFWRLFRSKQAILLDEILSSVDSEFWKLDLEEHSYFLWYPSPEAAADHPELPAEAIYQFYELSEDTSTLDQRPSLIELRHLRTAGEATNITYRLKYHLSKQIVDYDEYYRVADQIEAAESADI